MLDPARLHALHDRSLLTTHDWCTDDLDTLLAVASRFEALDRAGIHMDMLRGELAYAMFFDNSTRTKSAWAGAAARLGMHPVIVDGSSTQVSHGETAEETGAMLGMNAHALGVRHDLILGEGNAFMRAVQRGTIQAAVDAYRRVVTPHVVEAEGGAVGGALRTEPRVDKWIFSTDGVGFPIDVDDTTIEVGPDKAWVVSGDVKHPAMFGIGAGIEQNTHRIGECVDARELQHAIALLARFPRSFVDAKTTPV